MAAAGRQSVPSIGVALKQAKWKSRRKKKECPSILWFPHVKIPLTPPEQHTRQGYECSLCNLSVESYFLFPFIIIQLLLCLSFFLFSSPCFPIPMQPLRREVIEGSDLFVPAFSTCRKLTNTSTAMCLRPMWFMKSGSFLSATCECNVVSHEWNHIKHAQIKENNKKKATCSMHTHTHTHIQWPKL